MLCHNLLGCIIFTEVFPFTNIELADRSCHRNRDGRIFWEKKILEFHRVVFAIVEIVGFDMSLISEVVHIDSLVEVIGVDSLNLSFIPVIEPFVCGSILESVLPSVITIDINVVRDRGWVEWNDCSVGSVAIPPDTAADLFSFVENGRGPVLSVVADVGADIDVVLLDKNLRLPVSVFHVPLIVVFLSMRRLNSDGVRAGNQFLKFTNGLAAHVCLHGNLNRLSLTVDLVGEAHLVVGLVVQVIKFY